MFRIEVENIKCAGCVNSIEQALLKVDGVENVRVLLDQGVIIVTGAADRDQIISRLTALGYPEKGSNTPFCKAKSYVSCAFGRLS